MHSQDSRTLGRFQLYFIANNRIPVAVTIPIIVATKKCNAKPISGCDEFIILAAVNNHI